MTSVSFPGLGKGQAKKEVKAPQTRFWFQMLPLRKL